ncbi:MAG TPA: hypothetical protein VFC68_01540, partial [Treponemataceae bacterium]|nr:hypothetical protein [Treponemataceae bacterium]
IGIIEHRAGNFDRAAQAFKNALSIDSSSIRAKVNYELSCTNASKKAPLGSQHNTQVDDTKTLSQKADSVFSIIRESEQKRWKNSQQTFKDTGVIDY